MHSLGSNYITSAGVALLVKHLIKNKLEIRDLILTENRIDDNCFAHIEEYIKHHRNIKTISIAYNLITDKGIKSFGDVPFDNCVVGNFYVGGNRGITNESIPSLIRLVEKLDVKALNVVNASITSLNDLYYPIDIRKIAIKEQSSILIFDYKNITDYDLKRICDAIQIYDKGILRNLSYSFSNSHITSEAASYLFDTLKNSKSKVTSINLHANDINDDCMKSLGEYIQLNSSIESINLEAKLHSLPHNSQSNKGLEILSEYLHGNTTFRRLKIGYHKDLTDLVVPCIIKMIESSRVEYIGILKTSITNTKVIIPYLVKNVLKNGSEVFNMSNSELNDYDLSTICDVLKTHGHGKIKHMKLSSNFLTSTGVNVLLKTLIEIRAPITILNLERNKINDDMMDMLCDFIIEIQSIEHIILSWCEITSTGIDKLSYAIIGNDSVKQIELIGNRNIDAASSKSLFEIAKSSCVTTLKITHTMVAALIETELNNLLSVPVDKREIAVKSSTKSAAKRSEKKL